MNQIDANVHVDNDGQISYIGSECGTYRANGGNYVLTKDSWGGWSSGLTVGRNIFLNALVYFGGEDMGTAVWGLLDEHYRTGDAPESPISDALAAKYGLAIEHIESMGDCYRANVSNGKSTWFISYIIQNPYGEQYTIIKIPV